MDIFIESSINCNGIIYNIDDMVCIKLENSECVKGTIKQIDHDAIEIISYLMSCEAWVFLDNIESITFE